jgi:hypothetical protein
MALLKSCIIIFLLGQSWCDAQKSFEHDNLVLGNAIDAEKIYLQLTGKAFNTSEIVWFKAVVANVLNNAPSGISGVLHVELIDPIEEQVIDSKLLKLENGTAESFFQLHANYPEGKYLIRAYTEWNKNFGNDFIFSTYVDVFHFIRPEDKITPIRDITITKELNSEMVSISSALFPNELDSMDKAEAMLYLNWKNGTDSIEIKQKQGKPVYVEYKIVSEVKTISYQLKTQRRSYSKIIVLDENRGSLDFFPEGGGLVNEVKSTVGFKYLNYKGLGEVIEGVIVDQDNNELSNFKSNHLGMGKIFLRPETGRKYFGVVQTRDGTTYRYPIPMANPKGVVMRFIARPALKLLVLTTKSKTADSVFLKLYHRGRDILAMGALLEQGTFSYAFRKSGLPNGIIGATLYDSEHKPIAERHFYNHKPEDDLDIKITVSQNEYELRDSVTVHICSTKDKRPSPTSISLMAVNSAYFEQTNPDQRSILSYFMLESDIRGQIENPAFYFENKDHLRDLDYLMLTQGWTKYKYDEPKKPKIVEAEKGLTLSGDVNGVQNRKKRKRLQDEKFNLSLMTFGDITNSYNQEIDSTGCFNFNLDDSYGDGKKFVIEPVSSVRQNASFKVNIKERKIPEIVYNAAVVISAVDSTIEKTIKERIRQDIAIDPYLLPNTIALNEVVVSDYTLTPEREKMKSLHGMPDVVIDNKEFMAKAKNWTGNLYKWLLYNNPDELSVRQVGVMPGYLEATVPGADFTYILVDGMPVLYDNFRLVPDIPIEAVKSAEVIINAPKANRYFLATFPEERSIAYAPPFSAILAIYTYSGKGLFGAFPEKTNLVLNASPEFSPKREFYSPAYDNSDDNTGIPDLRTLIHWEPSIITDAKGNATVKFFNGDIAGRVLVICEGISITGDGIGRDETFYEIIE